MQTQGGQLAICLSGGPSHSQIANNVKCRLGCAVRYTPSPRPREGPKREYSRSAPRKEEPCVCIEWANQELPRWCLTGTTISVCLLFQSFTLCSVPVLAPRQEGQKQRALGVNPLSPGTSVLTFRLTVLAGLATLEVKRKCAQLSGDVGGENVSVARE
ncbi:hypothetical protein BaRGS_00035864 [Batillaria attramentaria]|uniref:Uncharacterized protein n=1 Tax=Batillaria attramentaria TaxID=370345 RepID=A0ABD0JDB7_9CAEN